MNDLNDMSDLNDLNELNDLNKLTDAYQKKLKLTLLDSITNNFIMLFGLTLEKNFTPNTDSWKSGECAKSGDTVDTGECWESCLDKISKNITNDISALHNKYISINDLHDYYKIPNIKETKS